MICGMISSHLRELMIGEVNRKLSKEEQISRSGIYLGKMQKIKAEYYRLYPTGRLDAWRGVLVTAACVFFALALVGSDALKWAIWRLHVLAAGQ